MLPFFRKIRKQLADDNKPMKYLRYAIGEIMLVVIGILIALTINNWNQNRLLKKNEINILRSLHAEFSENLQKLEETQNLHLTRENSVQQLLHMTAVDLKTETYETLDTLFLVLFVNVTFNPSLGISSAVINSGKIELISNQYLKIKISQFQDVIIDYQEHEIWWGSYTQHTLVPFLLNELAFVPDNHNRQRTREEDMRAREIFQQLILSQKFRIHLLYLLRGLLFNNSIHIPELQKEIQSIINLLESEIQKLEE